MSFSSNSKEQQEFFAKITKFLFTAKIKETNILAPRSENAIHSITL